MEEYLFQQLFGDSLRELTKQYITASAVNHSRNRWYNLTQFRTCEAEIAPNLAIGFRGDFRCSRMDHTVWFIWVHYTHKDVYNFLDLPTLHFEKLE